MGRCWVSLLIAVALVPVVSSARAVDAAPVVPAQVEADGLVLAEVEPQPVAPVSAPSATRGTDVADLRTEFSSTVVSEEGLFVTSVSSTPVNVLTADGWVPVDTTLIAATDGSLVSESGAVTVEVPTVLGDGVVSVSDAEGTVGFTIEQPADAAGDVSAVVDGSQALFADALPGVDVVYEALPDGVKETLVLESPAAGSVFRFPVTIPDGMTMQVAGDGVEVVDASGVAAFAFLPAFMDDAAGVHSDDVLMTVEGDVIVLSADPVWLADPARVWPVIIDPTLTTNDPTVDCSIQQADPTVSHCPDLHIKVGSQGAGQASRLLFDWDLEAIFDEPVVVRSSSLRLQVQSQVAGSTPMSLGVHELTEAFNPQATWNTRTMSTAWATAGGSYDATPASTEATVGAPGSGEDVAVFDVTAMVAEQVDRQAVSNGMLVRASNESVTSALQVYSQHATDPAKRPSLTVVWEPLLGQRGLWEYLDFAATDRASLAVNVASGNLVFTTNDLSMQGTGLALGVSRTYNSRSTVAGAFGVGWSLSAEPTLSISGANAVLSSDTTLVFTGDGAGGFVSPAGANATLVGNATVGWTMSDNGSGDALVFDTAGKLLRRQDTNGNQINNTYTSSRLTGITDTQGRTVTVARVVGDTAKVASMSAPSSRQFDYTYTSGRLTGFTGPAVSPATRPVWAYGYDGSGRLNSITTPRGTVTTIGYDSRDRVTSVTSAAGTGDAAVTVFTYNNTTDPLTTVVTDPRSQNTTFSFDRRGQISRVVDPRGHTRDRTYSPNGDVASFNGTDAVSGVSQLAYDTFNNLTSSQAPASGTGQTAATTAFAWNTTTAPYLLNSRQDPTGNCNTYGYYQNNPSTVTTGATPGTSACANATGGSTTTLWYDGQPKTGGGTWECSTKNTRQLCAVIDANNNTTLYAYDAQGNITTITPPAPLGATTITVDAVSRPVTVVDGKGQSTGYTYDAYDRITKITYNGDTACSSSATCTTMIYDADGNLGSRTDNTGTTAFYYSFRNQVTAKNLPGAANACSGYSGMQFRYDFNNNLTSVCDAGGSTVYRYNFANEMTSIQEPGASCSASPVTGPCTKIAYETTGGVYLDGRRAIMTLPPGTGVVVTYGYDNAGNLLSTIAKKGATTLASATYTYTVGTVDTDLRQRSVINGVTTSYGYDRQDQLCWAGNGVVTGTCASPPSGASRWVYDAVGNRTSQTFAGATTTYAYNAANQLCNTGTSGTPTCPNANWTYDANGNTTKTPTLTSLVYNAKDQNTSRVQSGVTTNFTYADIGQTERVTAGAITQASDILGLASESNLRYVRDPGGTMIGQRITSGGTAGNYYYLTDGLGSVTHIINSTGTVVRAYTYDAWGTATVGTGTIDSNIRYAGGYNDTNGLTKLGARYYNPTIGRWTQQDPAGNIDGPNPYLYTHNNPVNRSDPSGLTWIDFAGGFGVSFGFRFNKNDLAGGSPYNSVGTLGPAASATINTGTVNPTDDCVTASLIVVFGVQANSCEQSGLSIGFGVGWNIGLGF